MSWFSRCSWCGGPFNGGNYWHYTNVSFVDEPVYDSNSYNQTPDFSNSPSQPQTSSLDQWHCFHCKYPLERGERCQRCTCKWCGYALSEGFCSFCPSRDENSSIDAPNPNSFNDPPNDFNHPPPPQHESYSCELCGNDSHYGYDCPPQFPLAADINQSPLQEMSIQDMENLKQHYLDEMLSLSNQIQIKDYRNEKIDIRFRRECEITIDELKGKFNGISIKINKKKELQQVANLSTYPSQRFKSFCYDDDDYDYEESTIPLNKIESQIPPSIAITPVLPTLEPEDSLSMGDEHLSTIPENESDKVIKSSVENLVPIPRESKDLTDYESECDMPVCDDSSSKNEGLDDIVSIPPGKEIDHLDAIPDSIQSLLNRANSIIFLIEEFAGELAPIDPIPLGIVKADPNEDIRLIEKLLNDDSFPHSSKELNSDIPDAIIESFSPPSIPVEDSDSLMEEIDIFLAPGDSIPPGIENDDYDSEGDILFLEQLLNED
ncbi:hypothetical protein Tco_0946058 [Tanacetum coccineum]